MEFLDRFDLRDVTLVESDSGRAQTVAARHPGRGPVPGPPAADRRRDPAGLPWGHGRRLVEPLPQGRLLEMQDSQTLIAGLH